MNRLLLTVLVGSLLGLLPAALADEAANRPSFILTRADGTTATGPLDALGPDWSIRLSGQPPPTAKGADLITLRRSEVHLPDPPEGEQVVLVNGDRLPGKVLKLQGERLRFRPAWGDRREILLPLTAVAVFWITAPDLADHPEQLFRQLAAGPRRRDTLLLRNGDALEGLLTGLDRDGRVTLEAGPKKTPVDFSKVAAIALSTELARRPRPTGTYGHLVLANGGRLSLASAQLDGESISGNTLFGTPVRLAIEEIVALDLRQGRADYLSDLKPLRYEFTPYLGSVRWPFVADGSVGGRELRLGGNTYDKGIGMHSTARLRYDLGGRYQWFEAVVGLDDRSGAEGSVRVEVQVDDKPVELGQPRELTRATGPKKIRVRVREARALTLIVESGRHGDIQDHVDWADARLIR